MLAQIEQQFKTQLISLLEEYKQLSEKSQQLFEEGRFGEWKQLVDKRTSCEMKIRTMLRKYYQLHDKIVDFLFATDLDEKSKILKEVKAEEWSDYTGEEVSPFVTYEPTTGVREIFKEYPYFVSLEMPPSTYEQTFLPYDKLGTAFDKYFSNPYYLYFSPCEYVSLELCDRNGQEYILAKACAPGFTEILEKPKDEFKKFWCNYIITNFYKDRKNYFQKNGVKYIKIPLFLWIVKTDGFSSHPVHFVNLELAKNYYDNVKQIYRTAVTYKIKQEYYRDLLEQLEMAYQTELKVSEDTAKVIKRIIDKLRNNVPLSYFDLPIVEKYTDFRTKDFVAV